MIDAWISSSFPVRARDRLQEAAGGRPTKQSAADTVVFGWLRSCDSFQRLTQLPDLDEKFARRIIRHAVSSVSLLIFRA